jgi:hypothetical protein
MRIGRGWFSAIAVLLFLMATGSVAYGQADHVRWDIVNLDITPTPPCANAGGVASALAQDNSSIVLTGSGTFVAPGGGGGTSDAVTGGGTWRTLDTGGTQTGSGMYSVTGLVRWDQAPGTLPICDNIGSVEDAHSGLAVLRIEYSDGSRGHLVVSCHLPAGGTPNSIFEGVRASKGYVDYWNGTPPVGNTNRTVFHVR